MLAHRRLFRIVSMIVVFTLLFSSVSLSPVSAQEGNGLKREVNAQTGKVSFLGPETGRALSASKALGTFIRPQDPALALAKRFGPEFGLKNPQRELAEMKTNRPGDGRLTVRYQQNYEGIPVMGGEVIVNTNENGDLYSMNGEVSPSLSLSTQPTVDSETARQTALQAVAKWYQKAPEDFIASEPALWIYDESLLRSSTRPAELVWRMEVMPRDKSMPVRELVLVNGHRGGISLHFNQVDTMWRGAEYIKANPADSKFFPRPSAVDERGTTNTPRAHQMFTLLGATWYVATTGNDSNSCGTTGSPCKTINGAIGKAASGDTIKVAVGTYTGDGAQTVLIDRDIILSGGWNSSFTAQTGSSTVDGQSDHRCIKVNSGVTATLERFTIQNGAEPYNGAAGIWNEGDLTINYTTIQGNAASTDGGGILNLGTLTLNFSTITKNNGSDGGGLANGGYWIGRPVTIFINNSTISQNTGYKGGGIKNGPSGIIYLNNATVTDNETRVDIPGSGIDNNEGGTVTLKNTILAGNKGRIEGVAMDCYGNLVSHGYNLIGSNSDCTFTPAAGDRIGTSAAPVDPRLTALRDNGGFTLTHALMTGSPAINAGNPAAPGSGGSTCMATDQRGVARPVSTRCDIGAYEGSMQWNPPYRVSTYTTHNSSLLPGTLLCTELNANCPGGDSHAKATHKYAIGTYTLYADQHNRNSIDNSGMTILSTVHYGSNYENAFWDGNQMVFGDAYWFPMADDVMAHELTHGVTQYESNLFYYYQSGAINESFSDLWGEYYDQTNGLGYDAPEFGMEWRLGEDVAGLGAFRDMSDPPAFGHPDTMSSTYYYEGEEDSGGVHSNSGVNNKAVYLMVKGGSFNGKTVTALRWTKTAAIYYETNTKLLSSGADYSDLYYALQQACSNLIGQKEITAADCAEVEDALDAVEMNGQPAPNFNTDAPLCAAGTFPAVAFADDLEAGAAKWTFNNGAHTRWQIDSPLGTFAQSGAHSLYADDDPGVITNATARLTSFTVPGSAFLHFAQAYGFESVSNIGDPTVDYFDGGVLEYSTNNGATWVDAGSLMDYNGYGGTIFTGTGNPLSGRSAFVGDSHGYISTRLDLSSLAGQSVSFRWRMGLDEAIVDWGWWVDNIKLYTCAPPPGAFTKTSPSNGSSEISLSTTLSWSNSSSASSYQYCYDIINDNQCNRTWNSLLPTAAGISNLGTNITYYWQVRAVNAAGTTYADNQSWGSFATTSTLPPGLTGFETFIGTNKQGKYSLGSGQSLRESYTSVNNGPVQLASTNSTPLIAADRVIYNVNGVNTSFTEMMGLPDSQLDTAYWLPWYNNVDLDTQLRFANASTSPASVTITIGGQQMGAPIQLAGGASTRVSFPGVNNGPVKIMSTDGVPIVAAERVIYKVGGVNTSFSEMMALPNKALDSTYWLPWYNNVDLDTQLRIANVSGSPATVNITIGNQTMGSPIQLAAGASTRLSFAGVNSGPVKIESTQNIVAAERVIYKVNGVNTSFTEMMALPDQALDTIYWLPWYNNKDLDTQLRFANIHGTQTANVHVYIGGVEMLGSPFTLLPGESTRKSFHNINNGPVQIVSDVPIVAAERVIYRVNGMNTSFSEMLALPASQLDTTYWLPWYNNVDLDTQLRFGVP